MEQLQSNVRALDIRLDPTAMGALAGLAEDPATYWQTRSRLSPIRRAVPSAAVSMRGGVT